MGSSSQDWRKLALAGGLLLVLAYGLLQLPEVRGWHAPEALWEIKIRLLQQEAPRIEGMLKRSEADLQAAAGSWNPRLRRVQSDCVGITTKLKYLDAKLAALKVAVENRIPGASPALAAKLHSLLEQINKMQLQDLQYSFALENISKKLRTVKPPPPDQGETR